MSMNLNQVTYFETLFFGDQDIGSLFLSDYVMYRLSGFLTPILAVKNDFSSKKYIDDSGLYQYSNFLKELTENNDEKFYFVTIKLIKNNLK